MEPTNSQSGTAKLSALQWMILPVKVATLGVIFVTGCLAIVYTQFLAHLFVTDQDLKRYVMEFTKKTFVILVTFMTSYFSSASTLSLSFENDEMMRKCVRMSGPNRGKLTLDQSAIIIANHQIYSDWFYLWFIAYLNNCHDHIFIIMKDSLKRIPVLGYGMRNFNFVFLSRKWENDQLYMKTQFDKICSLSNKAWMLIFPEGTNINNNHLIKSHDYAKKIHAPIMNTVLLPRVKGLYLALKELSSTTTKIIDFTIGYSDHTLEEQAQDIFTLFKVYIEGQSPKKISVMINEYDMNKETPEIDLSGTPVTSKLQEEHETEVLTKWLFEKWAHKETLMTHYYANGNFGRPTVDIPLRLNSPLELLLVYVIPFNSFVVMYFAFKLYQYIVNVVVG